MTGLSADTPHPTGITVHVQPRVLQIAFADDKQLNLPFEYLHVLSPSAEMQGHGSGQEVLQTGKREVGIVDVESMGNYMTQPLFSDGHDFGISDQAYPYRPDTEYGALWRTYFDRLAAADIDCDAPMAESAGHVCGHSH